MPRILLVSNDESLCGMVRAFLGHAGFCVFVATSAERAESTFLDACEIDVWMVDVQALGVEGVSVAMRMRDSQPDTPLLIFGSEESDECSLLEFICDGWARLSKPVNLPSLLSTVHSSLLRVQYRSSAGSEAKRATAGQAGVAKLYRTWVSAAVALARFKRSQN